MEFGIWNILSTLLLYSPPMHRTITIALALFLSTTLTAEAASKVSKPQIISRTQWGANEEILTTFTDGDKEITAADVGETGGTSERARECEMWQKNFPEEFRTNRMTTHTPDGEKLRWPQRYSPKIELIVVHHTALKVTGDERSADERMRALYEYHANQNGWGDIGYNYVIDEKGKIYEGRAGGDKVVAGHLYCANVGTIGIAIMGNFELEQAPQEQLKSLKRLTAYLAEKNGINVRRQVRFHGKLLQPIIVHKDLGHTRCPGYYLENVMSQIREHIIAGNLGSPINSPTIKFYRDGTDTRKMTRMADQVKRKAQLQVTGPTEIIMRPGASALISLLFTAGDAPVPRRARIALVERSQPRIGIWQDVSGNEVRVRKEVLSPAFIRPNETERITLRIQVPRRAQSYKIQIGEIPFTIRTQGRRVRATTTSQNIPLQAPILIGSTNLPQRLSEKIPESSAANLSSQSSEQKIRIRLGFSGNTTQINTNTLPAINGKYLGTRNITLNQKGNTCEALVGGANVTSEVVRIDPGSGVSSVSGWKRSANRFRGVIECRIIDNEMVLINELPMEEYLWGLAEEPDTEPYEKQRAFAIAARSYATHYTHPLNRKFQGKPYDGDDSPARFQMYGGVYFEESNPRWTDAVKSTSGLVIMKSNKVVKTPYFSTDDGRTRSPSERGWNHFPFAEVFESKPDPWCNGLVLNGHGVGMSGCGAKGQALDGAKAEEILKYYYPGTELKVN